MRYMLLGAFGLVGVFARYFVNSAMASVAGLGFPTATLAINVVGSFLIGLVFVAGTQHVVSDDLRIAIMAGLLGGFTTFSGFSLDLVSAFSEGRVLVGSLYALGSVGGGVAATLGGLYVGKCVWA